MTSNDETKTWWDRLRPGRWSLVVAVLSTIVGGLFLAVVLIELFSLLTYRTWTPWTKARHDNVKIIDLVKIALAIVGGIGAAQALVVAYRRQRDVERDEAGQREREAGHRDRTRLMTERLGAAATQLGSEHAATRLAGVYAMAVLADDWAEQRQQCIDVLCLFATPVSTTACR